MKLFSEKVKPTLTNSSLNILQVEAFEEIFFGVYEIEINKSKYPVEKISEHNGNPVVSVPVTVNGVKKNYPFVLIQGKPEVLFNENNTIENDDIVSLNEDIPDIVEYPTEVVETFKIPDIVDNRSVILEQIEKAKSKAKREVQKLKQQKSKELQEESNEKRKLLEQTLHDARYEMVEEFVNISQNIKRELVDVNDQRFSEIQLTIDNKIQDLAVSLGESLVENFENSSIEFDSKIKKLVEEAYSTINPRIDKELENIATEIVEKVDSIEKGLDEKLKDKADKILIENVEGELNSIAKANIELNDKINKGVNKALSRVGNSDKKIDELTIALSEEVENKISKAEENITNYYTEKLKMLEEKTFDVTEETRKYIIDLVTESRNNLITEIRKINNEKPIEYIVESKGKKQSINSDDLVKDFDKKINSKIDNEVTRLRKYIAVYSGGGSVAKQFADGGTMNGNLTVVGSISASEYLGLSIPSGEYLPLSGGTLTGNLSVAGNLTVDTNTLYVDSTNNRVGIGTTSPSEALTVVGNISASGSITADSYIGIDASEVAYDNTLHVDETHGLVATNVQDAIDELEYKKLNASDFATNLMLFPTTAVSDLSGYTDHGRLVTTTEDENYDVTAQNVSTGDISGSDQLVGKLISDAGILDGDVGLINITTIGNIRKTGGREATFYFKVFKYDGSTETELCESDPTPPVDSSQYQQFSESALLPVGTSFTLNDRIIIRYYATRIGTGNTCTYDFQFGGDDPVRTLIPVPASVVVRSVWTKTTNDIYYNDGNVGIGTASPTNKLSIIDGSTSNINIGNISGKGNGIELFGNNPTTYGKHFIGQNQYGNFYLKYDTTDLIKTSPYSVRLNGNSTYVESGNSKVELKSPYEKITMDSYGAGAIQFFAGGTGVTERMRIVTSTGNVGIGTTSPSAKLDVNGDANIATSLIVGTSLDVGGHFSAQTKSFLIENPKNGGKLQYGVLEGPEHGVYVRGATNKSEIELPTEWEWLVDEDSVTVIVTPVGKFQPLFVVSQNNKIIQVDGVEGEYNYIVYGTRKDVDKLEVNV